MAEVSWRAKRRLITLVQTERRFGITLYGKDFICPYCLETAPRSWDRDKAVEDIVTHITEHCREFKGVDTPLASLHALENRKRYLVVKDWILMNPSWRIADKNHRWYCPYCGLPTDVIFSGKKSEIDRMLPKIIRHLDACFPYSQDPDNFKTVEEVQSVASRLREEKNLIENIRKKLEKKDDLWVQKDPQDQWICPYCLKSQASVSLATAFLIDFTAPVQMAQHVMHDCGAAVEGGKIHTLSTVKRVAESFVAEEDVSEKAGPSDTVYLRSLKSEILAIREDMKKNTELEESLVRARKVVQSMLPQELPHPEGYEFACYFKACSEVGGDFYDFVDLAGGKVGVAVGDVSGHGLEAALVMGMTKKALKLRAKESDDPKDVLVQTNADVFQDLPSNMFITCFYGLMNPQFNIMSFSRAGHNYTLVYRAEMVDVEVIKSDGMPLGMTRDSHFESVTNSVSFEFGEGDVFLQYTDGLTEAQNKKNELFGMDRFKDVVRKYGKYDAEYLVDKVIKEVTNFAGSRPQEDDIALVVIRRRKPGE